MKGIESIRPLYKLPDIETPERLSHAQHMTRVVKLESFSTPDHELFMKMDDETGFLMSGNKIRKLEYVFREILGKSKEGSEIHVITVGAAQSNHCRATVALCRKVGFIPHVFLSVPKDKTSNPDGNYFLMDIMGAKMNWVEKEDEEKVYELIDEYVKKLHQEKENISVHVVPVGASIAMGCFGYIECVHEIIKQFGGKENVPEYICVSTGSAGTICGIVLGVQFFGLKSKVVGISVSGNEERTMEKFKKIIDEFNEKFNKKIDIPEKSTMEICDLYIGEGYGIPYKEEIETIRRLATQEGIIIDPVYTGKGFHGVISEMMKNENGVFKKKKSRILFVHTGGQFGFMCQRQLKSFYQFQKN